MSTNKNTRAQSRYRPGDPLGPGRVTPVVPLSGSGSGTLEDPSVRANNGFIIMLYAILDGKFTDWHADILGMRH